MNPPKPYEFLVLTFGLDEKGYMRKPTGPGQPVEEALQQKTREGWEIVGLDHGRILLRRELKS